MATKTDRILNYLPGTFRVSDRATVLFALIDAFGRELLAAENSLAEIMTAHWVDYADRGSNIINDLEKLAALYGLAPRRDEDGEIVESVEEFREHLKRYIRTFLDGTVTVQGILRVTAEALGIRIADSYEQMDCWWNRKTNELVTIEPRLDDAAQKVFGLKTATAFGSAAQPALVKGSANLSKGVDLRGANLLRLRIDNIHSIEINFASSIENLAAVPLNIIIDTINQQLGTLGIAKVEDNYLIIASATTGDATHLEILDTQNDAAERLLGLLPRKYLGSNARVATVVGLINLSNIIDLSNQRYLRIEVDRNRLAEIDCAGANPSQTSLEEICNAINQALGINNFATVSESRLVLTSPTVGFNSSIALQTPAASDATTLLFGELASKFFIGQDARPAIIQSQRDLSSGVNLSGHSTLQFRVDGNTRITVNCAGQNPSNTRLNEIANAINNAFGVNIASQDGRFITLTSRSVGSSSQIEFLHITDDASEAIFGILPRIFQGSYATAARISGTVNLHSGVNLMAQDSLLLSVNGKLTEINLRDGVINGSSVTLPELVRVINQAVGANVAISDNQRLVLISPKIGSASSLAVLPLEKIKKQRFVTRAAIIDEATPKIFGFIAKSSRGKAGSSAQIVGRVDLSRTVDLSQQRYLRLKIDNTLPRDIDCAGVRPRATTISEIVDKINGTLGINIATHDGKHLILTSPSSGADSQIAIEPPQAGDALPILFRLEPSSFRGQDASRVNFIGAVDLSDGIELGANATIKLIIDGGEPVEIKLTEAQPPGGTGVSPVLHKSLDQLLLIINTALNQVVARTNGKNLLLVSPKIGAQSSIAFAVPSGFDVTQALFGITAPRTYNGSAALPALVVGLQNLSSEINLEKNRFLRITIDNFPAKDVDCAATATDPKAVSLADIKSAINTAFGAEIAEIINARLVLRSQTVGVAGRIILENYTSGDARRLILGDVESVTQGEAATPATITSQTDLISSVNLSQRQIIRLAVDNYRPVDINVAGVSPLNTFADEIAAAINNIYPNLATVTDEGKLQLTSPTTGEESTLAILPLRYLELIEYPPILTKSIHSVNHGKKWLVVNNGVGETVANIKISTPYGAVGATLINSTLGLRVQFLILLTTGATLYLETDVELGLKATVTTATGETFLVPNDKIISSGLNHGAILTLTQGKSEWSYLECYSSRFNQANFNQGSFACVPGNEGADCICLEPGIFDISRFANVPPDLSGAVFAASSTINDPNVEVNFEYAIYSPGSFIVNLPTDLPEKFGVKFNQGRFSQEKDKPELYQQVVMEKTEDDKYNSEHWLVSLIGNEDKANSNLVIAEFVERLPLGFKEEKIPFRKPKRLTLGNKNQAAQIYLQEAGVDGFIKLQAKEFGAWGNDIAVSVRSSGSAMYDVTISYKASRFENARQVVLGDELPAITEDLLKPGAIGILQAKAAGVRVEVSRDFGF